MRIYCYFQRVPTMNAEEELRLVTLWRQHHEARGFTPVVLNEWHARLHPYFGEYWQAIRKLPSVNPEGYDLACYLRWIAMAQVGGGMMTDYDAFAFLGKDANLEAIGNVASLARIQIWENIVPSVVTGSASAYAEMCERFAAYKPHAEDSMNGKPHISDMLILQRTAIDPATAGSFDRAQVVKQYGMEGWDSAPFVHFAHAALHHHGKEGPRWKVIPELIKEHK